ncbi:MAG: glycosyltransferase [Smithellaceae bacterium]
MVIIIYSTQTENSIRANIGVPDYSYYFVLKKFRPVLSKWASVIEVKNPEQEVDAIYKECRLRGEVCLFLSFTPPHKTITGLECPTISVFAWEYLTIPTDTWSEDPRNDWRYVFRQHGCAITHSSFAVDAVRKAMGDDFPIWSIPAPVWDDYTKLSLKDNAVSRSAKIDLTIDGTVIDFHGCDAPYISEENKKDFIEQRLLSKEGKGSGIELHLQGIIYTAIFNPGDNRKNWPDLAKGFIWAFRESEDVTLVLKVVHHDFGEASKTVTDELFKLTPFKCRVVILHGYLDDEAYAKLVRATTYIVNTAHGEGQCLPLMEFMSAGKPAIAPVHTAMKDYINENDAFIVKSSLERANWPHDPRYALRTMRYRINWESLYNAFLESYQVTQNNPKRYLAMSGSAVDNLKKYCSTAVVEERLEQVFCHLQAKKEIRFIRSFPVKTRQIALWLMKPFRFVQK